MLKEKIQVILLSSATRYLDHNSMQSKNLQDTASKVEKFILISFLKTKFDSYKKENIYFINVPRIWSLFYLFKIKKEINKILNKDLQTTLSAGNPFDIGILGSFLKYLAKTPLNIQVHTDIFSKYFLKDTNRNKLYYLISKLTFTISDSIRTVNTEVENILRKKYPKKNIVTIPEILDLKDVKSRPRKVDRSTTQFIYPARYVKMKNHENLFKAFKKFNEKYPNTILETFGSGPEKDSLYNKYNSTLIKINDWSSDIKSEYYYSDFLIFTSLYEGFGMSILEALKFGIPCLVTPFGGAVDLIENGINGFVADNFSEKSIYELLEKGYLNNNNFNEEKIKETVIDFSKENMDRNLINLWKNTF